MVVVGVLGMWFMGGVEKSIRNFGVDFYFVVYSFGFRVVARILNFFYYRIYKG